MKVSIALCPNYVPGRAEVRARADGAARAMSAAVAVAVDTVAAEIAEASSIAVAAEVTLDNAVLLSALNVDQTSRCLLVSSFQVEKDVDAIAN